MTLDLIYLDANHKMLGDLALEIYIDLTMEYAMKFKELVQMDIVRQINDKLKLSDVLIDGEEGVIYSVRSVGSKLTYTCFFPNDTILKDYSSTGLELV